MTIGSSKINGMTALTSGMVLPIARARIEKLYFHSSVLSVAYVK